jgi:hypothetical protein
MTHVTLIFGLYKIFYKLAICKKFMSQYILVFLRSTHAKIKYCRMFKHFLIFFLIFNLVLEKNKKIMSVLFNNFDSILIKAYILSSN